ncbi:peptidase S8 [Macrococcoides caseolyticum subsp. hominis]|uniref:S8 family peptidase n=1 Tax=Macrococcoides caseolyticum TaxID=69966 RepID=UPI000E540BBE|nr:S8 family peptidase [Macrococcus caseolyticus]RAI81596.1 peptidase S8 [Macrococcus caseolyticus subsp. hominis]
MDKNVFFNGAVLAEIVDIKKTGGPNDEEKKYNKTFEESKTILSNDLLSILEDVDKSDSNKFLKEKIFKVYIRKDFLAKSYQVKSLYIKSGVVKVGSNFWMDDNELLGKIDFLKGTIEQINSLIELILKSDLKIHQKELRRFEHFSINEPLILSGDGETNSYEVSFHKIDDKDELIDALNKLISINEKNCEFKWVNDSLILNIELDNLEKEKLTRFNPLRSCVEIDTRDSEDFNPVQVINKHNIVKLPEEEIALLPWVGVIDGGVKIPSNAFYTVQQIYEVDEMESISYVEHGTSVTSLILYGEIDDSNISLTPEFRVASIRGLPSKENVSFDLICLEKIIETAIPKYPNIKIWNLSIGPKGPINDRYVSSLTYILDKLAYEYDILFIIACGNTGNEIGYNKRLQIPSDCVNNISVSSYMYLNGVKEPASYNSIGPGRRGNKLKPDVMEHGGEQTFDPIMTFSTYSHLINKCSGTSFSTPLITRKLANILYSVPHLKVLELRALFEHYLANSINNERDIHLEAKGILGNEFDIITDIKDSQYKVLYSSVISAGSYVKLPIPLPQDIESKSAEIISTVAVKTPVNIDSPNKYTQYTIQDDFYPDSYKYIYRKNNKQIILDLNKEDNKVEEQILLQNGFKKSQLPKKQTNKYLKEYELENENLKWETVKTQKITKRVSSLNKPFIRLHGLSRDDKRDRIEYSIVITVKLKNDINLHSKISQEYPLISQLNVANKNIIKL